MPQSTVSVVIPAYNAEKCLGETLASVFSQTRTADEILVIDDGSVDDTEAVARSFGDRVRYIRQANQGIAGARNTGIREARGEWIAFLDHDDLMLPNKLQRQMAEVEANPDLVVVYSSFDFLYPDGTRKNVPAFPAKDLWPAIRYRTPILPSTAIIRRTALNEIGGLRDVYCVDDWDMWFRLLQRYSPRTFREIPETLTLYRWWENNESKKIIQVAQAALGLADTLLLSDLGGLRRAIWKRKIEARTYFKLAMGLRDTQNDRYWEYAIESFLKWPFFGKMLEPYRYVVFAHMLWTRACHFRFNIRYWWPVRRCREDMMSMKSIA